MVYSVSEYGMCVSRDGRAYKATMVDTGLRKERTSIFRLEERFSDGTGVHIKLVCRAHLWSYKVQNRGWYVRVNFVILFHRLKDGLYEMKCVCVCVRIVPHGKTDVDINDDLKQLLEVKFSPNRISVNKIFS
jgi:hypothetical protein